MLRFTLLLASLEFLSWRDVGLHQIFPWTYWNDSVISVLECINIMHCIYGLDMLKHPCTHEIKRNWQHFEWPFYCVVEFSLYFIKNFCIFFVCGRGRLAYGLLLLSLSGFCFKLVLALWKEFGSVTSLSILWFGEH